MVKTMKNSEGPWLKTWKKHSLMHIHILIGRAMFQWLEAVIGRAMYQCLEAVQGKIQINLNYILMGLSSGLRSNLLLNNSRLNRKIMNQQTRKTIYCLSLKLEEKRKMASMTLSQLKNWEKKDITSSKILQMLMVIRLSLWYGHHLIRSWMIIQMVKRKSQSQ